MRIRRSKKLPLLVAGIIAAGVVAAAAIAAVTSQQVLIDTGNLHMRSARMTADGFDSGWHVHPGIAIVQVQEGSLQIYQGSCVPKTVSAGDTFIEVPHLAVRAIATGHVGWTTTLITNGTDPVQIPLSSYAPGYNPCPSLP